MMPRIIEVRLQCDGCGFEPSYAGNSLEAGTDDLDAIIKQAEKFARAQGMSVTDRGVFCGSNGRCNFDGRWRKR